MFKLTLHDREGTELNEGDLIKISDGKAFSFYSEVKWLADTQVIAPFHIFTFHSFLKVDKLPDTAILSPCSKEDRCKYWYVVSSKQELDKKANAYDGYLRSWLECEKPLEERTYRITKL